MRTFSFPSGTIACLMLALAATLFTSVTTAGVPGGHQGDRPVALTLTCDAVAPVVAFDTIPCTVLAIDNYGKGQTRPPEGVVSFSVVTGTGDFSPASCSLSPVAGFSDRSSCSVTFTPHAGGDLELLADFPATWSDEINGYWLAAESSYLLTVDNPPPTLFSISPEFGVLGDTLDVVLSGENFVSTGASVTFGAGVTVNSITWVSSSELVANVSIDPGTTIGGRDVTVTNPAPAGGSSTLTDGFEVRNPLPSISGLSPSAVEEGHGSVSVTISGDNFVPDSIAYFDGGARTTSFVNSGELVMELTAADTAVVGDYDVQVRNESPGGGWSNTAIFSVVVSGGSFDVVEAGEDVGARLFMKLAGIGFNVDVLATDIGQTSVDAEFEGDAIVELLDASDDSGVLDGNGCRASWNVVGAVGIINFTAADGGRININTTVMPAMRSARFRVSHPASGTPSHVGCSSDAFSVRPQVLTLATALNNEDVTGAPTHAAGNGFEMTVSAVAGYDGTPQIDADAFSEHAGAVASGTLSGSFPAADAASGDSVGTFSYDEAGHFSLAGNGIHDDSFTAIDQPGDCTDNFSNTAVSGRYGCKVGIADAVTVGRFVPDHFDVTIIEGCDTDGFTYSRQPFTATVTARNLAGDPTENFHFSTTPSQNFAKDVTLSDQGDDANLDDNVVLADYFDSGIATVTNIRYSFPDPETGYSTITLRAIDVDGVSSAGHLEPSTEVRSGRVAMVDANAVTDSNGYMDVLVQTWQESSPGVFGWDTHADDQSCTGLGVGDFSLDAASYTGNLEDGETAIINFSYSDGEGILVLAEPGTGNDGSVKVDADIDDWLYFDRDGVPEAPSGIMTFFEIFRTEPGFIFRQEVVN